MNTVSIEQSDKIALQFGAGNIGRGFIGALLACSGYKVIFADINNDIIDQLNAKKSYRLHILDKQASIEQIHGVAGVLSHNEQALKNIMLEAQIITTAVGANVLPIIARSIAQGIEARAKIGAGVLTVIACENRLNASSFLQQQVEQYLSPDAQDYLREYVGFANASVDRIVPPFDAKVHGGDDLDVGVEAFYEWYVEAKALKGDVAEIVGLRVTDNLNAYVQRKLYTLNTAHAIAAYLGSVAGLTTVGEAMQDKDIAKIVLKAMQQSGAALIRAHHFDAKGHDDYIKKIQQRFLNPYIRDEIVRVGREPQRKLAPHERLIGPAWMASEFDLPQDALLLGAAAALHFNHPSDLQSVELQQKIQQQGLSVTISELTQLSSENAMHQQIQRAYYDLAAQ